MKLKKWAGFALLLIAMLMVNYSSYAQSEVIKNVRTAMRTGSSKELVLHFNNTVELTFDGEKSSYSRTQAEFVLREFFKKHPPIDFEYIHQGASEQEALWYVIGKYSFSNGSFRFYMLIKLTKGEYLVDLMDFSEE